MVVSEIGARLSPKNRTADHRAAHQAHIDTQLPARGHITAETAVTVPVEVPQAVEITTQIKNATTGIKPVLT